MGAEAIAVEAAVGDFVEETNASIAATVADIINKTTESSNAGIEHL